MKEFVKPQIELIKFVADVVYTSGVLNYPDFNGEPTTSGEEKTGW